MIHITDRRRGEGFGGSAGEPRGERGDVISSPGITEPRRGVRRAFILPPSPPAGVLPSSAPRGELRGSMSNEAACAASSRALAHVASRSLRIDASKSAASQLPIRCFR